MPEKLGPFRALMTMSTFGSRVCAIGVVLYVPKFQVKGPMRVSLFYIASRRLTTATAVIELSTPRGRPKPAQNHDHPDSLGSAPGARGTVPRP
jgi:hypothetical protein